MIMKLKEDADQANKQDKCRQDSEGRNQGLVYVNITDPNTLASELGPQMKPTNQSIGNLTSMTCDQLPFNVAVNTLKSSELDLSGDAASGDGMSTECVDFASNEALGKSLLGLQKSVAGKASDLSRGDQGLDKDTTVTECGEKAELECKIAPSFSYNDGDRKQSATITCDIDSKFKYTDVFGMATFIQDSSCPKRETRFTVVETMDDPNDGCDPLKLKIERSATDCCKNRAQDIHFLTIKPLPPSFKSSTLPSDYTGMCDDNIHPRITGAPEPVAGCKDAPVNVNLQDESVFDLQTCVTTVKRTFTVEQNGCEDLRLVS